MGDPRMTLRRLTVATMLLCALCAWGFASFDDLHVPEPATSDGRAASGNHDDAEARFRSNQNRHWRHVALGNRGTCP